jgi:hypothetical protein
MPDPTLIALLSRPLPRGMRCATCAHWTRDPIWTDEGYCAERDEDTMPRQGCVYWQARPGCGLDYMGVPLASPLAQED